MEDAFFKELYRNGTHFRLENDEEYYYLSIIDRTEYPRIWNDNFRDSDAIIAESSENLINRSIGVGQKDWKERWSGESVKECIDQCKEWINKTF